MNDEIKLNELDVQKLNLKEGDVLMVTVKHEDIDVTSMEQLRNSLGTIFPNNKVAVFAMGSEGYVKFTVASQPQLSYCSDCDCGKKEQVELGKASTNALKTEVKNQLNEEIKNDQS